MDVRELNDYQLEYLKNDLFYNYRYNEVCREQIDEVLTDDEKQFLLNVDLCFWMIPNELIFKVYTGISFVEDDFGINEEE